MLMQKITWPIFQGQFVLTYSGIVSELAETLADVGLMG
jgi:hypothetical protein